MLIIKLFYTDYFAYYNISIDNDITRKDGINAVIAKQ